MDAAAPGWGREVLRYCLASSTSFTLTRSRFAGRGTPRDAERLLSQFYKFRFFTYDWIFYDVPWNSDPLCVSVSGQLRRRRGSFLKIRTIFSRRSGRFPPGRRLKISASSAGDGRFSGLSRTRASRRYLRTTRELKKISFALFRGNSGSGGRSTVGFRRNGFCRRNGEIDIMSKVWRL